MSKELSPLEALNEIKEEVEIVSMDCDFENCLNIIETALKKNQTYEEILNEYGFALADFREACFLLKQFRESGFTGIEKTFERLHDLQQMLYKMNVKHGYKEYLKIIKALDTIKEKNIDFKTLKEAFIFDGTNKEQCEMYNLNQWSWVFYLAHPGCVEDKSKYKQLTQEEYELLKEVLL